MNSIRYLKKWFSRSPNNTKAKATQAVPEASPAKSTHAAQPNSDSNAAIHSTGAASTTSAQASTLPSVPRHLTAVPVECAAVQDERGGKSDAGSINDSRPRLQPKHQKDRHIKHNTQYVRPDYASKMIAEEFNDPNDPMPKGYVGTIGDIRYCHSAVEDYCPCGTGGGHYLTCGHMVVGEEACGQNCKTGAPAKLPFNCPRCLDIVNGILQNKLTKDEQAKIEFHRSIKDTLAVAVSIEYIAKHLPTAKGNIAETVLAIMVPQYGRECRAVLADAGEPQTIADLFQEHHSSLEQKTRARLAQEKLGSLNTHDKRKDFGQSAETPDSAEVKTPTVADSINASKTASTTKNGNKKQKRKLETLREPVSQQNRGIKRTATSEGWLSDPETLVGNGDSPIINTSNKKLKKKLETHRQPITLRTRGVKRKPWIVDIVADSPQSAKRTMSSFPRKFEEAAFLPIPPRPTPTLGGLVRKRDQNVRGDASYSNKRQRSLEVLPGSDVEISAAFFAKKRMALEEYVASDNSDEL